MKRHYNPRPQIRYEIRACLQISWFFRNKRKELRMYSKVECKTQQKSIEAIPVKACVRFLNVMAFINIRLF